MKKIMFAVMAMCAIGFTACGNKAQTAEAPADEVEAVVYNAEEEAAGQTGRHVPGNDGVACHKSGVRGGQKHRGGVRNGAARDRSGGGVSFAGISQKCRRVVQKSARRK